MSHNANNDAIKPYLSGQRLYGDNFSAEQIDAWFADEAEGYFDLTRTGDEGYAYGYHALNQKHGFSALPQRRFNHVLGIGAAYGDELRPVLASSDRITILEPASGFQHTAIDNVPVNYVQPVASGVMPFADGSFDLITCFGVLHHIPNVSQVVQELFRVARPGGFVLIREPVISMGDWRTPRKGLTKRERGIPLNLMREIIRTAGFDVVRERKCMFSLTSRLRFLVRGAVYNNSAVVALDALLSRLPVWPDIYHARNAMQKLRPTAVYCVLRKPASI